MAYVQPTIVDLKARFPSLSVIDDVLLALVLGEAIDAVGELWLERDRAIAQLYYAAHLATSQGLSDGGLSAVAGPVKRDKVGDSETEFAGVGGISGGDGFGTTAYGLAYLRLLRLNFPGIAVA